MVQVWLMLCGWCCVGGQDVGGVVWVVLRRWSGGDGGVWVVRMWVVLCGWCCMGGVVWVVLCGWCCVGVGGQGHCYTHPTTHTTPPTTHTPGVGGVVCHVWVV